MGTLNISLYLVAILLVSPIFSSNPKCPSRPIITVERGGRTANCIFEYFAVYFASKYLTHKQIPYSQKYINDLLSPIFDNVSLPIVEDIPKDCECCRNINWYTENTNIVLFRPIKKAKEKSQNVTGNIVLSKCVVLVEPMAAALKEIKEVLPYKKHLVSNAQNKLQKIKENYFSKTGISDVTFVGVHVRRTDYIKLLIESKREIAGPEFYLNAMQYFRNRTDLGHPVFVIGSDDPQWSQEHLSAYDVYISLEGEDKNIGYDMVLLSYCNHSIADYGTFSMWTSLYTEGEVVTVYQSGTQFYLYLRFNPKWHFVDLSKKEILIP